MLVTRRKIKRCLLQRERKQHAITLSASSINSFQTCHKMYYYDKVARIKPAEKADALSFGSVVHKGLECIFRWLAFEQSEKEKVRTFAIDDVTMAAAEASLSPEDLCKAKAMIDEYIDLYFDENKSLFEVIEIEDEFKSPICNRNGRPDNRLNIRGYIDAVVKNRITGEYFVVEHKTAGQVTDGYLQRVEIDWQVAIYIDTVRRRYGSCAGVIYDVLKKPKQERSLGETDGEFEARKAASKTGRIKRKTEESINDFYTRVRASVDESYFIRQIVKPSDAIMAQFRDELYATAKDILNTKTFSKSTCNCLKYGTCPYMDLCCNAGTIFGLEDKYTIESEVFK